MAIRKGDKAPTFQLPEKPRETVDLAEYIGKEKVVLLFFPFAFSPPCTSELCHFRDSWKEWENLGAKVFGISVDNPFVTAKFREVESIPFPILSDFNKEIANKYGALHEELMGLRGVAKRSVFVIDESGTVIYDWVSEDPLAQVPFEDVKKALAQPVGTR